MTPLPSIRHLQFFIALVSAKNYHRAADKLGISQPALTAAIKELEHQLGGPLIDRSRKKIVTPTLAGSRLFTRAAELIKTYEEACETVRRDLHPDRWVIRMGVVPTIAPFLLPHLLPVIERNLPGTEVRIIETTSKQIRARMDDGEIDFALMAFPFEMPGCHQWPLMKEKFVCAVPEEDDPFCAHKDISVQHLYQHRILLLEDGHCLRDHARDACRIEMTQEETSLKASSIATLIQMVAHGQGITLLPEMAADYGMLPPGIKIKHFNDPMPPSRTIGVAWRRESPFRENYEVFGETIKTTLREMGYFVHS